MNFSTGQLIYIKNISSIFFYFVDNMNNIRTRNIRISYLKSQNNHEKLRISFILVGLTSFFMKKVRSLTPREMEQIAKFSDNIFKFDLSRISMESFDSLMRSLPNFASTNLAGIGFTNDLLVSTKRRIEEKHKENPRNPIQSQLPFSIENSASTRKPDYQKVLSNAVAQCLKNTKTITFLKFRFLNFKPTELDVLASAIYSCVPLRVLKFCDVPMGDSGFSRLCRSLRRKGVIEIQFRKCGLTDECAKDLRSLLSFQVFIRSENEWKDRVLGVPTSEVSLQMLDLRDNDFTFKFIDEVQDSLLDLPLSKLDLRGNLGLTELIIKDLVQMVPKIHILVGPTDLPKSREKKYSYATKSAGSLSKTSGSSNMVKDTRIAKIRELEDENARLRALIEELKNGTNIAELENDLLIVGPRSLEFVEHITNLDKLLGMSRHSPTPFLKDTRKRLAYEESRKTGMKNMNIKKKLPTRK